MSTWKVHDTTYASERASCVSICNTQPFQICLGHKAIKKQLVEFGITIDHIGLRNIEMTVIIVGVKNWDHEYVAKFVCRICNISARLQLLPLFGAEPESSAPVWGSLKRWAPSKMQLAIKTRNLLIPHAGVDTILRSWNGMEISVQGVHPCSFS